MNKPLLPVNRRTFLRRSSTIVGGTAVAASFPAILRGAADTKPLKVALVGCGGRGSGAASQALKADAGAQLVYMADAFKDHLDTSLNNLRAA